MPAVRAPFAQHRGRWLGGRSVSINDVLDLRSLDRVFLDGYVPKLQVGRPGGPARWRPDGRTPAASGCDGEHNGYLDRLGTHASTALTCGALRSGGWPHPALAEPRRLGHTHWPSSRNLCPNRNGRRGFQQLQLLHKLLKSPVVKRHKPRFTRNLRSKQGAPRRTRTVNQWIKSLAKRGSRGLRSVLFEFKKRTYVLLLSHENA